MKFKTSTLALSATLAAGLASSAFAVDTTTPTPTPYANLAFKTNQTYTVTVNETSQTPSNGAWNVSPAVEKSAIVIDSDSTDPLTFTPTVDNSVCDATELNFNVEASFVPATVDLAPGQNARCGFAIKLNMQPRLFPSIGFTTERRGWSSPMLRLKLVLVACSTSRFALMAARA